MRLASCAIFFCTLFVIPSNFSHGLELFVAPSGNNQNPGTRQQPLATLTAARDLLRKIRSDENYTDQAITVTVLAGTYLFDQPLTLGKQDTGSEKFPIVYQAADGQKVTLSGSRPITNFQPVTDERVLSRLDPGAKDHIVVANLAEQDISDFGKVATKGQRLEVFFAGQPMQLARWPNEGFEKIVDVTGPTTFKAHGIPGTKEGIFTYDQPRPSRWLQEPDVRLHGYWFWDWSDSIEPIEKIDTGSKTIHLKGPNHNYGYRKNQRYYALNLLCELDQPGEWYLDRQTGKLYFWPPSPIENNSVTVSVLPSLLKIQNCHSVSFQGFNFEEIRSAAVHITNSQNCTIEHCTIRNTGSWAVHIKDGNHCGVYHSQLENLGEGGVSLQGGDRSTLTPAQHECVNNHIQKFGRLYRTYRPAVLVGGVGQHVAHNHIHHGPHNAIQLSGNEHQIEFNEIHHVCHETGDVGAFYMGRDWTARGTTIRHNFFHDITGPGLHGAMAVYLDDAASGMNIIGNVFLRAGRAAFIGGGRDNLVENNIFVDCEPSVHVDARGVGWMHKTIAGLMPERLQAMPFRDSPWKEKYPQLLTLLDDEPGLPKYNIVRHNISWGGRWLDIQDPAKPLVSFANNLVDEDPHFAGNPRAANATIEDFQLQSNSPAYEQGFQPIPLEKIGLLK